MRGGAGVNYPIGGARRRGEVDGAEGGGEGVGVPWGRDLGRRLIEGTGAVGRRRDAGQQCLLRWRTGARGGAAWAARRRSGPHVNGPSPRVVDRGPLWAPGWSTRGAAVAAAAATATTASVSRRTSSGNLRRTRRGGTGSRWWCRGFAGRGGDECRCRGRRSGHVELGEAEVSANLDERREGALTSDELGHELKAFVQSTE
jgi:hypothetical protein